MTIARCPGCVTRSSIRRGATLRFATTVGMIVGGLASQAVAQVRRPVLADDEPPKVSQVVFLQPTAAAKAAQEPVEPVCRHRPVDRPLSEVQALVSPGQGELPEDAAAEVFGSSKNAWRLADEPRPWSNTAFHWQASWLAHYPLCFEEKMLERYGYSHCPLLQPAISGAHFFGTLPILPYKKGLDPHHQLIYELGFARPGDCSAPALCPRVPWNNRAAAYEAGFVTGLIFFIP